MTLLEEIADFANLLRAFKLCARGKRNGCGYKKILCDVGGELVDIRSALLDRTFCWRGYRHFLIRDPKMRNISAAPFRDRMVHTAICRVIEPIIERHLSLCAWACRKGMGNRNAVIELACRLRAMGPQRFAVKLDVRRYFESIPHDILLRSVGALLPDDSIDWLLVSLLSSHREYAARRRGIPIGNLPSQLFANFYLASADLLVMRNLKHGFYIRYMDDMLLAGMCKSEVLDTANAAVRHIEEDLKLEVPFEKWTLLGGDPIPFLGFVVDHKGHRILARTRRRHGKQVRRMRRRGARESTIAIVKQSFGAFSNLDPHLGMRLKNVCL